MGTKQGFLKQEVWTFGYKYMHAFGKAHLVPRPPVLWKKVQTCQKGRLVGLKLLILGERRLAWEGMEVEAVSLIELSGL